MDIDGIIFNIIIWLFLIEILVGGTQLIGAFIRTIIKLKLGKPIGKLKNYWVVVIIYLIVFIILYNALIYFSEKSFAFQNLRYDEATGEYDYTKNKVATNYYNFLEYTYISIVTWTAIAWLIVIWYWKNIVFTKDNISTITKLFKK